MQGVIPFDTETAIDTVGKLNKLVDELLELGGKIQGNEAQLRYLQSILRQQELNANFFTIKEVAEALHCTTKTAFKRLEERGVEILDFGKTYVVNKEQFLNAFIN